MNIVAPVKAVVASREPRAGDPVRLSVQGIAVAFGGQQVLRGIDFELAGGQIALLRGANGCGKTTLLNILSGFLRPDGGQVTLQCNGRQVNLLRKSPELLVRLGIARLWQEPRLFPTMTVLENVLAASPRMIAAANIVFPLVAPLLILRRQRAAREQALHWLDLMGVADRAGSSADKLSVGQSKRVAIARLLQTGAQVLLLDEPLASLDAAAAEKLAGDLNRLADTTSKALLVIEHGHRQEVISPVCDMRLTLENGRASVEAMEGCKWSC